MIFCQLYTLFLHAQSKESTPIYSGWKRKILSLMVLKSWHLIQLKRIPTVGLKWVSWPENVSAGRLVELATLGRCRGCCGVNRLERTILRCS